MATSGSVVKSSSVSGVGTHYTKITWSATHDSANRRSKITLAAYIKRGDSYTTYGTMSYSLTLGGSTLDSGTKYATVTNSYIKLGSASGYVSWANDGTISFSYGGSTSFPSGTSWSGHKLSASATATCTGGTAKTYTVTLDPNSGTWTDGTSGNKTLTKTYGVSLSLPDEDEVSRTGYLLAGWSEDGATNPVPIWSTNANKTIKAVWDEIKTQKSLKSIISALTETIFQASASKDKRMLKYLNTQYYPVTISAQARKTINVEPTALAGYTPVGIIGYSIWNDYDTHSGGSGCDDAFITDVYFDKDTTSSTYGANVQIYALSTVAISKCTLCVIFVYMKDQVYNLSSANL